MITKVSGHRTVSAHRTLKCPLTGHFLDHENRPNKTKGRVTTTTPELAAARRARDAGMANAESRIGADQDRAVIDQAVEHFASLGRPFSANDVRRVLPQVASPLIGARFLAAARRGLIERVGSTLAQHEESHAHSIGLWIRATGSTLPATRKQSASLTPDEEATVRAAHWALEARGRGKGGFHSTSDAARVVRDLLTILGRLTGIDAGGETLL